MSSSTIEPIPQTIEAYKTLAQRDLELIEEQQREIGRLKGELNERKQQLDNDPNDDSYERVNTHLLNLRNMADQLLTED